VKRKKLYGCDDHAKQVERARAATKDAGLIEEVVTPALANPRVSERLKAWLRRLRQGDRSKDPRADGPQK
jgi:hypothetical protein